MIIQHVPSRFGKTLKQNASSEFFNASQSFKGFPECDTNISHDGFVLIPKYQNFFSMENIEAISKYCKERNYTFSFYGTACKLFRDGVACEIQISDSTETDYLNKTVIERANAMLKDQTINDLYQSYDNVEDAKEWICKVALATLIIPVEERKENA